MARTERRTHDLVQMKIPGLDPSPGDPSANRVFALVSSDRSRVDKALVFVHGWDASARPMKYWRDLLQGLLSASDLSRVDLFVYGYRPAGRQIGSLSASFQHFLRTLSTGELTHGLMEARLAGAYGRIVLVGHSLGGVITRKALLDAFNSKDEYLPRIRQVLFAPAHCGARVPGLITSLLGSIPYLDKVVPILKFKLPVADDLSWNAGGVLQRLRAGTEAASMNCTPEQLLALAAGCAFGERELVVVAEHYNCDARHIPDLPGRGHSDIHRPTPAWEWPTRYVERALA